MTEEIAELARRAFLENDYASNSYKKLYVVRTLKSISAIELFKVFPQLKSFYARRGVLWSKGYFVSTIGDIRDTKVIKYIEEQKKRG